MSYNYVQFCILYDLRLGCEILVFKSDTGPRKGIWGDTIADTVMADSFGDL